MFEQRKTFFKRNKVKILSAFIAVFCITCLDLCAEEMSAARAKVYRENLVTEAKKYIGCPYVFGAIGPDSFDCSGLVYHAAREANGTQLPRTAKALYAHARIVPDSQKEPGDLVFFKTTSSGNISHVGIYIGNNQFISAVSDGPNTGVILSSLKEAYWKPKYMGCGQIYRSGKMTEIEPEEETETEAFSEPNTEPKNIADNILFDANLLCAWSLVEPNSFMINFRGADLQLSASYKGIPLAPGLGLAFRYNAGLNVFQIPLLVSITPIEYIRFYAGPIFTFGTPQLRGSTTELQQSVFPGVIGVSFFTPSVLSGKVKLQFIQDISYSVCNTKDGAALGFVDAVTAGLVLFSGIRITFPLSLFTD